jgi:hypothetical protein
MTGWAGWQHAACGHAPLPVAEDIQWRCRRLAIGAGAAGALARAGAGADAILHLTC